MTWLDLYWIYRGRTNKITPFIWGTMIGLIREYGYYGDLCVEYTFFNQISNWNTHNSDHDATIRGFVFISILCPNYLFIRMICIPCPNLKINRHCKNMSGRSRIIEIFVSTGFYHITISTYENCCQKCSFHLCH